MLINNQPQHGGYTQTGDLLTISNPNGSGFVYYTLDGSDPRLPGGAASPQAIGFDNIAQSETLQHSLIVKARSQSSSGAWSALAEATFAVGPVTLNLRVTELMYHPADPNTEFIELQNIGSETINLNMVRFIKGVDYTFGNVPIDPDHYLLLVRNKTAFEAVYPDVPIDVPVFQWTSGALDNDQDKIQIVDAQGQTVQQFTYKDGWYDLTDGEGFSLTIRNSSGDLSLWDDQDGWRASLYQKGSPGYADNVLAAGSIVISEVLAHSHANAPDWIELYNTTSQDINIGGWFLSDKNNDEPNAMKFEIPVGVVIRTHDYLVFTEDLSFGNPSAPGCRIPFGLSEAGETVYLHSGEAGLLTGYYQTEENFDASDSGVTLGRYEKTELSDGYDFTRMATPTQGTINSAPMIPQIVITEIYYNPIQGTDYEFVELYNQSTGAITLMTEATTETSPGIFITQKYSLAPGRDRI